MNDLPLTSRKKQLLRRLAKGMPDDGIAVQIGGQTSFSRRVGGLWRK